MVWFKGKPIYGLDISVTHNSDELHKRLNRRDFQKEVVLYGKIFEFTHSLISHKKVLTDKGYIVNGEQPHIMTPHGPADPLALLHIDINENIIELTNLVQELQRNKKTVMAGINARLDGTPVYLGIDGNVPRLYLGARSESVKNLPLVLQTL